LRTYTDYIKSDVGFWIVESEDFNVCGIKWSKNKPKIDINRNNLTDSLLQYLVGYFEGVKVEFNFPLQLSPYTDFQNLVWTELMKIPYGKTISYKSLARKIGNPSAIRAVANANAKNPFPIIVPCHRVIGSDGSMTGYAHGIPVKKYLLELENAIPQKQLSLF